MIYIAYIWGCNKIIPRVIGVKSNLEELKKYIADIADEDKFENFCREMKNVKSDDESDDNNNENKESDDNNDTCDEEEYGPRFFYDEKGYVWDYTLSNKSWENLYRYGYCNDSCSFGITIFGEDDPDICLMENAIRQFIC